MNSGHPRALVLALALGLALLFFGGVVYATAPSDTQLVGTWVNVNPNARGIAKIVITDEGGSLKIHAYGVCHPTPCDWGANKGRPYSTATNSETGKAFSARYRFGFSIAHLSGVLSSDGRRLTVQSFTHFIDGSNRYDYYVTDKFQR